MCLLLCKTWARAEACSRGRVCAAGTPCGGYRRLQGCPASRSGSACSGGRCLAGHGYGTRLAPLWSQVNRTGRVASSGRAASASSFHTRRERALAVQRTVRVSPWALRPGRPRPCNSPGILRLPGGGGRQGEIAWAAPMQARFAGRRAVLAPAAQPLALTLLSFIHLQSSHERCTALLTSAQHPFELSVTILSRGEHAWVHVRLRGGLADGATLERTSGGLPVACTPTPPAWPVCPRPTRSRLRLSPTPCRACRAHSTLASAMAPSRGTRGPAALSVMLLAVLAGLASPADGGRDTHLLLVDLSTPGAAQTWWRGGAGTSRRELLQLPPPSTSLGRWETTPCNDSEWTCLPRVDPFSNGSSVAKCCPKTVKVRGRGRRWAAIPAGLPHHSGSPLPCRAPPALLAATHRRPSADPPPPPPPLPQLFGQDKPVACGTQQTNGQTYPRCTTCMVTCAGTSCYSCWSCVSDQYGCFKACTGPTCSDAQPCCDPVALGRPYEPRQFCSAKAGGRCIVHPCDDGGMRPDPPCTDQEVCVVTGDETATCQKRERGWAPPALLGEAPASAGCSSAAAAGAPSVHAHSAAANSGRCPACPSAVPTCSMSEPCQPLPGGPNLLCWQGQCKVHPCWVAPGTTPKCTAAQTTCKVNGTGGYQCVTGEATQLCLLGASWGRRRPQAHPWVPHPPLARPAPPPPAAVGALEGCNPKCTDVEACQLVPGTTNQFKCVSRCNEGAGCQQWEECAVASDGYTFECNSYCGSSW